LAGLLAALESPRVFDIEAPAIGIAAFCDQPESSGARSSAIRAIAFFTEKTEQQVGKKKHSIHSSEFKFPAYPGQSSGIKNPEVSIALCRSFSTKHAGTQKVRNPCPLKSIKGIPKSWR
jgi:hypothetical protein